MTTRRTNAFYARSLLAAAMVWVFGVTVCSTRAIEMEGATPHDHADGAGHDHHGEGTDHDDHGKSGDCGCSSFNAFPTQMSSLVKAPIPSIALLYTVPLEEFSFGSAEVSLDTQSTGPPERVALSERILERCLLNHAPPMVG